MPMFWDGGRVYKVRFRPDVPGVWKYRTSAASLTPGLNGQTGTFEVAESKIDNPFLTHGPVRVSKAGPHLEHADGTPFFFLADTAWNGPAFSTPDAWKTYLADRKAKKFSAIQFNVCTPWRAAEADADGRTTLTSTDPFQINPEYFKRLDARMDAIADAGLLAVPVLLWANTKGDIGTELSEADAIRLAKYIIIRYHSYPVLWILAGDHNYKGGSADRWKRIGREVFGQIPAHLDGPVTTHPSGMNFPWQDWRDETWLDIYGYQSGHGDSPATFKWTHSGPAAEFARRKDVTKPIINLEPAYEDILAYQSKNPHDAYSVRRSVYWSLLSTPIAGVTYGAHGIWGWANEPGTVPANHKNSGVQKVWSEAMKLPGSRDMKHVATLFESLPWTDLRPDPKLITRNSGAKDPAKFVACAATPDRTVIVAYFPAGADAEFSPAFTGKEPSYWFDPRTGKTQPAAGPVPPDKTDWVLVVQQPQVKR